MASVVVAPGRVLRRMVYLDLEGWREAASLASSTGSS